MKRWAHILTLLFVTAIAQAAPTIKYIFWIKMENHSLNSLFVTFPGVQNVSLTGLRSNGSTVTLAHAPDSEVDCGHSWADAHAAMHIVGGIPQMDSFDLETLCTSSPYNAYVYHVQADIPKLWSWTASYGLSDNFFQDLAGQSYPNHLYTDAATSDQIINNPNSGNPANWGCESAGQTAPAERPDLSTYNHSTCFDVTTIQDRLDAAGIAWLYYAPNPGVGGHNFATLSSISHIYNSAAWTNNVKSYANFVADVGAGTLPLTSFFVQIIPDSTHNQHPVASVLAGDTWLDQQLTAIQNSIYWQNSATFITWDDWGGFFDPAPPPQPDFYGLGPRVPLVVVSPFAKRGYISHVQTSPASILAQIEHTFGVACLTTRDCGASDLSDMLVQPNWSGVLAPARAIDWSTAGATITDRSTPCATQPTLAAGAGAAGANSASMNAAITAASGGNCVINLPAGIRYFDQGFQGYNTHDYTIRGAGSNATFAMFLGLGAQGMFYVSNNDTNYSGSTYTSSNSATWTATSYAQGQTALTFSSHNNLFVGSNVILDQLDDTADTGDLYVSEDSAHATNGGGGGVGRPGTSTCNSAGNPGAGCRSQMQQVQIASCGTSTPGAACTSNSIIISPGLYSSNWSSSKAPGAWWSTVPPAGNVGLENLSMDASSAGSGAFGIRFHNVTNSWVKGVRSVSANVSGSLGIHVQLYQATHCTVRDSYFYGSGGASQSYGVDSSFGSADNLIENNIFQHISTATIREGDAGSVFGHNYAVDNFYTPGGGTFQQGDGYVHAFGHMGLWEGNIGAELELDNLHGTNFLHTAFRNWYSGFDTGVESGVKTGPLVAMQLYAFSRYNNLVANVLGTAGKTTTYSTEAQTTTDDSSTGNNSVFDIGYSAPGGVHTGASCCINDLSAAPSLMRWGNYSVCTGVSCNAVRFVAGENGSAAPVYPGLPSPNTTLPASFYLNAKPTWWTSMPWPAIGPDVTSGTGPGGFAYLNPAGNCYIHVMGGQTDGSSGALAFDSQRCYYPTGITSAVINGKVNLKGNVVIK